MLFSLMTAFFNSAIIIFSYTITLFVYFLSLYKHLNFLFNVQLHMAYFLRFISSRDENTITYPCQIRTFYIN